MGGSNRAADQGRLSGFRKGTLGARAMALALVAICLGVGASSASAAITEGGLVMTAPKIYAIYWGKAWVNNSAAATERARLNGLIESFSGTSWAGILTQYWGPNGFVSNVVNHGTPYVDEGVETPSGVNESLVQTEVNAAIKANEKNGWPKSPTVNDLFVVFTPPGTTYATSEDHKPCGYHRNIGSYPYAYVGWDSLTGPCSGTVTLAHEFAEAATDPYPLEGWDEIADECGKAGRSFIGSYEVPALWDNYLEKCATSDASPPQIAPEPVTDEATAFGQHAVLNGHIYKHGFDAATARFEWGTEKVTEHFTEAQSLFGSGEPKLANQTLTGLAPNTTYKYRVVFLAAKFPYYELKTSNTREFKTKPKPSATTEAAAPVTSSEAQLNATVNPNGLATTYWFEYGEGSFGSKIPASPAKVGEGTEPVSVHQALTSVTKGKTYQFRVVAESDAGTTEGATKFVTIPPAAPQVTTGSASNIAAHGATLNGTVNPEGGATEYWFEYGPGTEGAYTTSVPVPAGSLKAGTTSVPVSASTGSLAQNQPYHFRLVAKNSAGTTPGGPVAFTTLPESVLCKASENPCHEANRYGSGTALEAALKSGTKSVIETSYKTLECESSSLKGATTGAGGVNQTVPFELSSASFGGCNATFTPEALPWHGYITRSEGAGAGILHLTDMRLKTLSSTIFGNVTCYYGGAVDLPLKGGAPAELTLSKAELPVLSGGSGLCNEIHKWSATYSFSAPNPAYVEWP